MVVMDVPVRELLFSLARDAKVNVDVHSDIKGHVTLNAVNQTLSQILDRIAEQVPLRYTLENGRLVVRPDTPYLQTYRVDYLNISRDNRTSIHVASQISTTGMASVQGENSVSAGSGGSVDNNSITAVRSESRHHFWETLTRNILAILGEEVEAGAVMAEAGGDTVIVNREAGLITVRATARQHRQIRTYLERVLTSVRRQVLIEATVVEVQLKDEYQFGVDWSLLTEGSNGFSFDQSLLGSNLSTPPFFLLKYTNIGGTLGDITAALRTLQTFGDVKVLSSPKIMAINNQTALLKVVDNLVYFTVEADTVTGQSVATTTFTTTVNTVPVGFIMSVTPQINREDMVILNVRPSISRVTGYVEDPNPALADADVVSRIPEIQVREMESILRIGSGQTAVLGGLIQDDVNLQDSGLPLLRRVPLVGRLFNYKHNNIRKSELVIFLRPRVIRNASIEDELSDFSGYLEHPGQGQGKAGGAGVDKKGEAGT
ncbi:MAG TPA: pilus (MSHA type) biogenesis protein MshL [Gammaproteobacteria bacterium]|nr:pilus (MSHA type) biogenesis protein MshL [Gammaproteobacteria bacterium]